MTESTRALPPAARSLRPSRRVASRSRRAISLREREDTCPAPATGCARSRRLGFAPSCRKRGSSLLEAVAALGIGSLALAAAAEQVGAGAAYAHEALVIGGALSAARAVLDATLAAPCAPLETAAAACSPAFSCAVDSRVLGVRATESGPANVVRVEVAVTAADEAGLEAEERTLARLATATARPQSCE